MSLFDQMSRNVEEEGFVENVKTGRNQSQYVFSVPKGAENAIVLKLMRDPRTGNDVIPIDYFQHAIGNSKKEIRTHPCRRSLKIGESPERVEYNRLNDEIKAIRDSVYAEFGSGEAYNKALEGNDKFRQLSQRRKIFNLKRCGYVLFVRPDDPTVYALKLGTWGLESFFGKKGWKGKEDVPGALQNLKARKLSPFVDKNPEQNRFGWLKVYRTGDGLDTVYHAELLETQVTKDDEFGVPVTSSRPTECNVHKKIYEIDDVNVIPDPMTMEIANAWTEEESRQFVKSGGGLTGVPERLLNPVAPNDEARTQTTDPVAAVKTEQVQPAPTTDDIPF